jgi:lysophospholipase L1-like esterase
MRLRLLAAAAILAGLALPATAGAHAAPKRQLYVSLGDSYAVGYQPTVARSTRHGFADQIPALARKRGYRLKLVNFGCGGATTASILHAKGCGSPPVRGPKYPGRTQAAAAERFLRAHRGQVALVTVSIGGNDVTACAAAADPIACVSTAVESIKRNVGKLAEGLRRAAGPKVRIVGTTYPDVILGLWVHDPPNQDLAKLSIVAFEQFINPALQNAYAKGHAGFVDVTSATGAYGSLDRTTTLAPYGTIPVPVAKVCRLTYYCSLGDIHSRTSGYHVIAKLVAATLPRRKG